MEQAPVEEALSYRVWDEAIGPRPTERTALYEWLLQRGWRLTGDQIAYLIDRGILEVTKCSTR